MWKSKLPGFVILVVMALALTGCVSNPAKDGPARVSQVASALDREGLMPATLVAVPVANNVVSQWMMSSATKAGVRSPAVDGIATLMKSGRHRVVAVFGEREADGADAWVAAVVEAALAVLESETTVSTLVYVGSPDRFATLEEAASKAGVGFRAVALSAADHASKNGK